jgi:hypothetical protein
MRRIRAVLLVLLTVSGLSGAVSATAWAEGELKELVNKEHKTVKVSSPENGAKRPSKRLGGSRLPAAKIPRKAK